HKSNQLSTLADESSRAVARLSPLLARVEHAFNLEAMPAPKQPRKKNSIEDTDPQLESLLHEAETKPLSHRAADKYWKSASEEILVHPARGGALTYEQAHSLGLTPPEEN
ncbi:MAG: hypothetical protein DWG76_00005, partial [Chloroflexi bacterium]|nr:hypothetical protein [Chloroflexota bacterium]